MIPFLNRQQKAPLLAHKTHEKWGHPVRFWEPTKIILGPAQTLSFRNKYSVSMPWSLRRYYDTGGLHFITCSCHKRERVLNSEIRRDLLLNVLENMRLRYRFVVVGYVIMPEHFHLLMSEPRIGNPSKVIQAIKLGFSRKLLHPGVAPGCPISRTSCAREVGLLPDIANNRLWMRRFYDFNVWSERKEVEKLHYMHQNPVVRGLVERPEDWKWSSFRFYALGEIGPVKINDWSWWERRIRAKAVAS